MSVLNDILSSTPGIASGAADVIGAIKGTPQTINYIQPAPQSASISPMILVGGGLLLVVVLFMVVNKN